MDWLRAVLVTETRMVWFVEKCSVQQIVYWTDLWTWWLFVGPPPRIHVSTDCEVWHNALMLHVVKLLCVVNVCVCVSSWIIPTTLLLSWVLSGRLKATAFECFELRGLFSLMFSFLNSFWLIFSACSWWLINTVCTNVSLICTANKLWGFHLGNRWYVRTAHSVSLAVLFITLSSQNLVMFVGFIVW
jgi:hypothetical protein